jgi:GTP-binding protein HflX
MLSSCRHARVLDSIEELLPSPSREVDVFVPYARAELAARIHQHGEVISEKHTELGTEFVALVPDWLADQLRDVQS